MNSMSRIKGLIINIVMVLYGYFDFKLCQPFISPFNFLNRVNEDEYKLTKKSYLKK
jgi:hypothetical protein